MLCNWVLGDPVGSGGSQALLGFDRNGDTKIRVLLELSIYLSVVEALTPSQSHLTNYSRSIEDCLKAIRNPLGSQALQNPTSVFGGDAPSLHVSNSLARKS